MGHTAHLRKISYPGKAIKLEQSYNQTRTSVVRKKKSPFSEKPFVHTWIPFTLWCFILAKFDCMGDMICMENKIFWSRQCMSFSLSTKTVVHYFIKLEFQSHKNAFRIGMVDIVSAISKSGEDDCWKSSAATYFCYLPIISTLKKGSGSSF